MTPRWFVLLLLVACVTQGAPGAGAEQVSQLNARHRAGQTFLTWKEVDSPVTQNAISVPALKDMQAGLEKEKRLRYRIYRSRRPIT